MTTHNLPQAIRHSWALRPRGTTIPDRATASPQARLATHRRPTVRGLLAEWGPWICCMALMGMCEDGIPLAMRLYDPKKATHYLFFGQDDGVLATLVEPILYSMTVQEYGPEHWAFTIVSEETTEWSVANSSHAKGMISPYERDGRAVIPTFAGLMEQRSFGRHRGPKYVLVLHDIGEWWHTLDEDSHKDIIPLLRQGHEYGIHVVATLRYEQYDVLPREVRRLFQQKVYGYTNTEHLPNTTNFREIANLLYYELAPWQAWVSADGEWLRYTAPRVG